ncbi:MAG: tyrosine-protein phosphatase [Phycisphaerales bacterium]|nr:tyrosine-protein phosphatase [Phycisphaerales bacterium]
MNDQEAKRRRFDPRPGAIIILVLAIVGGGIWWWAENRHRFFPKRWGEVVPGSIYRSGQLHEDLVERVLDQNGIDLIISLRPHEPDNPDHLAEREAAKRLGIDMIELELSGDGTGSLDHYVTAVEAMHQARQQNQQSLVHCAAGAYRTGVAVSFYRLLVEGAPAGSIRGELRAHGWRNKDGDLLIPYLNENMAEMASRLQERGVVDVVIQPVPIVPSE